MTSTTLPPWRFCSKRLDPETSYLYFGRRYYCPTLGRFISPDPHGFDDGPNLYAYAHNSPYFEIDLYGEWGQWLDRTRYWTSRFGKAALDFGFPCASALYNFPPNAPLWKRGALAFGIVGEAALIFAPPIKMGASLAEKTIFQITRSAAARTAERKLLRTAGKTSSTATERKIVHSSTRMINLRGEKFNGPQWRFPEDPAELLKALPRDHKGRIYTSDNLRIRPEKHLLKPGDAFNPRHHGQHYHIEIRRNPQGGWQNNNIELLKPPGYEPGSGTGLVPGEFFPGLE